MAQVIRPDGVVRQLEPASGKAFSLEELQRAVGGPIEEVVLRDGRSLIVNEEGRLKGLSINAYATAVRLNKPLKLMEMHELKDPMINIVGTAVLVDADQIE